MKSEHRRELHANELEKLATALGKFFEQHGKKVLAGLAGAAVIAGVAYFVVSRWGRGEERATEQLNLVFLPVKDRSAAGPLRIPQPSAESFLSIADNPDWANSTLSVLARLRGAELELQEALELYFTDRRAGQSELKKVQENFQQILQHEDLPNWVRERTLYGLAVTTESLSDGETAAAITAYRKLLKEFPDTPFKEVAEQRIRALHWEPVKEFYAFLATEERRPADRPSPTDLRKKRLQQIHGGRIISEHERPVELPRLPPLLDLDWTTVPQKSPGGKTGGPALPFPPQPEKPDKKSGGKEPARKTPAKSTSPAP